MPIVKIAGMRHNAGQSEWKKWTATAQAHRYALRLEKPRQWPWLPASMLAKSPAATGSDLVRAAFEELSAVAWAVHGFALFSFGCPGRYL